jgi:hypothetical protein
MVNLSASFCWEMSLGEAVAGHVRIFFAEPIWGRSVDKLFVFLVLTSSWKKVG